MEQQRRQAFRRLACGVAAALLLLSPAAAGARGSDVAATTASLAFSPGGLAVVEYEAPDVRAYPVEPAAMARWAEESLRFLTAQGYRHPEPPVRIRLALTGDRLYGRFGPDGVITVNPYGPDPLKTLDHELFHWVQQAYPGALLSDLWWLEATAEWFALFGRGAERTPTLRYGERLNAALAGPQGSPYPGALFLARLTHRFGPDIIREAMERGPAPAGMVATLAEIVGEDSFQEEFFTFVLQAWLRDTAGPSPWDLFSAPGEPVEVARGAGRVEPLSAEVLLVRLDSNGTGPVAITLAWEPGPGPPPGALRLWVARFHPDDGVTVDTHLAGAEARASGAALLVDPRGATALAIGVASLAWDHAPLPVRIASVTWQGGGEGGAMAGPPGPAPGRAESRATYLAAWHDPPGTRRGVPAVPTDAALWTAPSGAGLAMAAAEWRARRGAATSGAWDWPLPDAGGAMDPRVAQARVLAAQGRYASALAEYFTALAADPDPAIRTEVARIYLAQGNPALARAFGDPVRVAAAPAGPAL